MRAALARVPARAPARPRGSARGCTGCCWTGGGSPWSGGLGVGGEPRWGVRQSGRTPGRARVWAPRVQRGARRGWLFQGPWQGGQRSCEGPTATRIAFLFIYFILLYFVWYICIFLGASQGCAGVVAALRRPGHARGPRRAHPFTRSQGKDESVRIHVGVRYRRYQHVRQHHSR